MTQITVRNEGKPPFTFTIPDGVKVNEIVYAISRTHKEIAIAMRNYLLKLIQCTINKTPYGDHNIDPDKAPFMFAMYMNKTYLASIDQLDPEFPSYDPNGIYLAFECALDVIKDYQKVYVDTEDVPDYADVYLIDEFAEDVKDGSFIDYDGFGHLVLNGRCSRSIRVYPSTFEKMRIDYPGHTHIAWFNK